MPQARTLAAPTSSRVRRLIPPAVVIAAAALFALALIQSIANDPPAVEQPAVSVSRAFTERPDESAVAAASRSFAAIQREGIGALHAMGFTPSEARALVWLIERGGTEGASARSIVGARSRGEWIDPRVLGRLQAHGAR